MNSPSEDSEKDHKLGEIESGVVDMFSGMVRMLGLPPSIGAIYGLLYVSPEPLCLDDFVAQLGISKGSASQGLAVLKKLGALRAAECRGRREYFHADMRLKMLVGGFLRSEVLPNLERGQTTLVDLSARVSHESDPVRRHFLEERLGKLSRWQNRGKQVLGLLHRFLD